MWLWGILFFMQFFFFTRARGGGRCSSRAVGQWRRLSGRGNEIDKANLRKCCFDDILLILNVRALANCFV